MKKHWLMKVSIIFLLFYQAHAFSNRPRVPEAPYHPIKKAQTFKPFTVLSIDAPIKVTLHTQYRQPGIELVGDPRDLAQLVIIQQGSTVRIQLPGSTPKYGPIQADIRTQRLQSLEYTGNQPLYAPALNVSGFTAKINNAAETQLNGQIDLRRLQVSGSGKTYINGVNTQALALSLSDEAKVQITGVATVSDIHLNGHAWLSMYWVKSKFLNLKAKDHAFVQLAGIAWRLEACISDHAHFNGQYLRARDGFVRTFGESLAEINILKSEHTLALGQSDIYSYHKAINHADFMEEHGAVLDMRPWQTKINDKTGKL